MCPHTLNYASSTNVSVLILGLREYSGPLYVKINGSLRLMGEYYMSYVFFQILKKQKEIEGIVKIYFFYQRKSQLHHFTIGFQKPGICVI